MIRPKIAPPFAATLIWLELAIVGGVKGMLPRFHAAAPLIRKIVLVRPARRLSPLRILFPLSPLMTFFTLSPLTTFFTLSPLMTFFTLSPLTTFFTLSPFSSSPTLSSYNGRSIRIIPSNIRNCERSPLRISITLSPLRIILPVSPLRIILPLSPLTTFFTLSPLRIFLPLSPLRIFFPLSPCSIRTFALFILVFNILFAEIFVGAHIDGACERHDADFQKFRLSLVTEENFDKCLGGFLQRGNFITSHGTSVIQH